MSNYCHRNYPLIRRSLPLDRWPELDRELWQRTLRAGDLFTDPGGGAHWRSRTRESYRKAVGRYSRFLEHEHPDKLKGLPETRLDRETILAYVESLKKQGLNPTSVWGYLSDLNNYYYRALPHLNWAWLRDIVNRLHLSVNPRPHLAPKLVAARDLWDLGLTLMRRAEREAENRPVRHAVDYRDGLMIALLITFPVRLQNFGTIELDRHLRKTPDGYVLMFGADEVKNKRDIEGDIYEQLASNIDRYLSHYRPLLLQQQESDALWVSKDGTRLKSHHVGARISKVTERELGKRITPHMFRHCAATSIAEVAPQLANIIRPLLGQSRSQTQEKYYNRASILQSSQRHAEALAAIREDLTKLNLEEVF